jgi:hypothetical protein
MRIRINFKTLSVFKKRAKAREEERRKVWLNSSFDKDELLFLKLLEQAAPQGILNPYQFFGYEFVVEDYALNKVIFFGSRNINGVTLITTNDLLYLYCEKKFLATLVDLLDWILISSDVSAANDFICTPSLPLNKIEIFNFFLKQDQRYLTVNLVCPQNPSLYWFMQTLHIYVVCGARPDMFYSSIMLKTRKIDIFDLH